MQVKRQIEPPASPEDPPQTIVLKFNDGPFVREFTQEMSEEGIMNVQDNIVANFHEFLEKNGLKRFRKEN